MAYKRPNRVKVNTNTTGTSDVALGTPVAGFQSFADGGVENGDTVRYILEEGPVWEIGIGTYNSTGPVLERTTVIESSNADEKIVLEGAAVVHPSPTGADFDTFAVPHRDEFLGDGTEGPYTLTWTPQSDQHIVVFAGGTPQPFTLDGNEITFDPDNPIPTDAYILVVGWEGDGATTLGINSIDYYWPATDGTLTYNGADALDPVTGASKPVTVIPNLAAADLHLGRIHQDPIIDYSVDGVNIVFTSATSAADGRVSLRVRAPLGISVPADDSVSTAKLQANSVTYGKLDDGIVNDATDKTTPVDADEFMLWDSVATALKKLTWANLKAALRAPDFTSTEQTVAVDTLLTVAHGLGSVPRSFQVSLRCKTANAGYAVDDEIPVATHGSHSGQSDQGVVTVANATNIHVVQGSSLAILGKASFDNTALTSASWRWVIRAWK